MTAHTASNNSNLVTDIELNNSVNNENVVKCEVNDITKQFSQRVEEVKPLISPFWRQIIAITPLCIAAMEGGMAMGQSATLLPQLKQNDENIPSDEYTGSWIASIVGLVMIPASFIAGVITEKYGRKIAIIISSAFNPIGWLLIGLAPNLAQMLAGRFLIGAGYGFSGPLYGIYIGEITDPKNRGFMYVMMHISMAVGVLLVHGLDLLIYWRWTACICGVISILQIAATPIIPESPIWLIANNKIKDGADAFSWLRGYDDKAKSELKHAIDNQISKKKDLNLKQRTLLLTDPQFFKPFILILILFVISQCSGENHLVFYAVDIVNRSVSENVDNNLVILGIDAVRVITSGVSCLVNKKFARRVVFFTSAIGAAISMGGLILYLYFSSKTIVDAPWLPVTCLISFMTFVSLGILPMPGIACSELFPINLREIGNTSMAFWCYSMIFLVSKFTPMMFLNLGDVITFGVCLIIIVIGGIVVYIFLPETKDKTLQEIQDNFKSWI